VEAEFLASMTVSKWLHHASPLVSLGNAAPRRFLGYRPDEYGPRVRRCLLARSCRSVKEFLKDEQQTGDD
jgi:hypothetical protein